MQENVDFDRASIDDKFLQTKYFFFLLLSFFVFFYEGFLRANGKCSSNEDGI